MAYLLTSKNPVSEYSFKAKKKTNQKYWFQLILYGKQFFVSKNKNDFNGNQNFLLLIYLAQCTSIDIDLRLGSQITTTDT